MKGAGPYWDRVRDLFELYRKRLGVAQDYETRAAVEVERLGAVGEGSQMMLNFTYNS